MEKEEEFGRALREPALGPTAPEPASGLRPTGDDPARGVFQCGHPREGRNVLRFSNGNHGTSSRCRTCHNEFQRRRNAAGRSALRMVLRMYREGTLSEGQVRACTGLSRFEIRTIADTLRDTEQA